VEQENTERPLNQNDEPNFDGKKEGSEEITKGKEVEN